MGGFCLPLLPLSVILCLPHHSWMLPALQELSMGSLDMRHTLTWRPLAVPCSTATLYTVQFQGEFERSILNDSWLDAPQCRRTPRTHCDLTSDLGSDSDYGVRVRAECGQQVSLWARLSGLFNRRDASLSPPEMAVEALGDGVRISFQRLPQTASVNITVWRQGREREASTDVLPADQTALLVAALQEGGVYCVQAWTYLDPQRRSGPTHTQCVTVWSPEEPWKKPTVAMVTAVATVTLLLAVLWSVGRCRAEGCHAHFQKQPLPLSLRPDWPTERRACPEPGLEICQPIAALHLVEFT